MNRQVRIGGMARPDLLAALEAAGVGLNAAARALFADARFVTSPAPSTVAISETTVAALGLLQGGTMAEIVSRAAPLGLFPCPVELGPHLRLQYLDQPEGRTGQAETKYTAPPGSLTVISLPIADDDEVPKGFYLRRIDGVPWLRGYRADAHHVWEPGDRLVFAAQPDV